MEINQDNLAEVLPRTALEINPEADVETKGGHGAVPALATLQCMPTGGLEPPRPKPLEPKSSASTNSARWA